MRSAIVIGTSYGGLEALKKIITSFPSSFHLPIFVVLHIGEHNNDSFINYLNGLSTLNVKEAESTESIVAGTVYFAPPNYHMLIEDNYSISFSADPKVHHSRPSIDVLFESAAWTYKNKLIGVILTGLNQDGAIGLKAVKNYGGFTIVENPEQAVASIMPKAAIANTDPDLIMDLESIASKIIEISELL